MPTLPVIRTAARAEAEGLPIFAVVLDRQAHRLGSDTVEVTASLGEVPIKLAATSEGIWKAVVRSVRPGEHRAELRATWKDGSSVTGRHAGDRANHGWAVRRLDPERRLLTRAGKHLGPITGSYRGQSVFSGVGTARESLLHGQDRWEAAIADREHPDYGFHFWESLTPRELDQDYAYLERCGWRMIHLCSAWLWWPRFDVAGRLSPFYAEQIDEVCRAAGRHGLFVHLAVSHYPLGQVASYARVSKAGYQRSDTESAVRIYSGCLPRIWPSWPRCSADETVLSTSPRPAKATRNAACTS